MGLDNAGKTVGKNALCDWIDVPGANEGSVFEDARKGVGSHSSHSGSER